MKLKLSCFQCNPTMLGETVVQEIEDNGVYSVTCRQGHRSRHLLSNPKFEVLFEMGVLAFADGYTREAVATFAAASEEFFRFFVKCVFARRGLYDAGKWDESKQFWKVMDRAEPQLGAFIVTYFFEFEKMPAYPDTKSTELRNRVIHRGTIPKEAEVEVYADKMLKFVIPLYREYRKGFEPLMATGFEMASKVGNPTPDQKMAGSHYPTVIASLTLRDEDPTFKDALEFAGTRKFFS